ncbi:hypothetical protein HK102_010357 [Quaeritorhiza haematococci]|nr:hypothetical protein HK102_010357 [Quaeritorhiza haematococci]
MTRYVSQTNMANQWLDLSPRISKKVFQSEVKDAALSSIASTSKKEKSSKWSKWSKTSTDHTEFKPIWRMIMLDANTVGLLTKLLEEWASGRITKAGRLPAGRNPVLQPVEYSVFRSFCGLNDKDIHKLTVQLLDGTLVLKDLKKVSAKLKREAWVRQHITVTTGHDYGRLQQNQPQFINSYSQSQEQLRESKKKFKMNPAINSHSAASHNHLRNLHQKTAEHLENHLIPQQEAKLKTVSEESKNLVRKLANWRTHLAELLTLVEEADITVHDLKEQIASKSANENALTAELHEYRHQHRVMLTFLDSLGKGSGSSVAHDDDNNRWYGS